MKKWIVNGDVFETAEEVAQFIIDEADMSEEYDNMLDECCGDVNILGMTYCASEVLSRVDPIAYRCGYSD